MPVNFLDQTSTRAAVEGARVVYHLAYGNDGPNRAAITIEGTRNIVEAATAAGVECVVILSTMYVFGFPDDKTTVDESFPYRPYGGEYTRSEAKMERWVLERAKSSLPTRVVVLNPTCVYGPGGGAYTCLPVDLSRKGQFCWIENGTGLANYTYVGNVVDAIMAAVDLPSAHRHRVIINDGAVTWREFISPLVEAVAGDIPSYSPRELARLPRFGGPFKLRDLMRAAASAAEVRNVAKRSPRIRAAFALANRLWPRPPMGSSVNFLEDEGRPFAPRGDPPEWLGDLYGTARVKFSSAKAQNCLNWSPRIDLAAGQALTIAWLVENGRLPRSGVWS